MMKDVLTLGTARQELSDFAALRPAAGKTGTQEQNWTAVFVGATPFLSTAVLVRDPARYTPMDGIPEFVAEGVPNVQGGTYPARIWGAYMEPAHVFEPVTDWPKPPPLSRPPARLYLPGVECLFRPVVTATTEPTDDAPDAPTPDGAGAPDGDVTDQAPPTTAPRRPIRPRRPCRRPARRSPAIRRRRRFRRRRCTRRSTVGRRSRPTSSIRGRHYRRHRGPSMLHRADDRSCTGPMIEAQ